MFKSRARSAFLGNISLPEHKCNLIIILKLAAVIEDIKYLLHFDELLYGVGCVCVCVHACGGNQCFLTFEITSV